ncbi:MAG: TolC family protein [Chitinophagaceae bacterium]|nr:TolC family protein [Chitinophagaceae bacterium]
MRKSIFLFLLFLPGFIIAQNNGLLSYQQAVAIALKNNFDILIAANQAEILNKENQLGNAGFFPTLDFNASGNAASNTTRQEFANGQTVNRPGVISTNISAGAFLSYTVFDGWKMFATKERLRLLAEQGELSFKLQIETVIENLTLAYYQIVRQEQLIRGIRSAMEVSEERIQLAEKKLQIGSGSKVEVLQGKLDLNAQKANLIQQQNLLREFRQNLLLLMQSDSKGPFSVDSNFVFDPLEAMDDIQSRVERNNRNLLSLQKGISIIRQQQREIKSQQYPRLVINNGYAFGRNQSTAGFALFNQNIGNNLGFVFTWNIFNGWNTRRQLLVADLQLKQKNLEVDQMKASLFTAVDIAYMRWLGDREALSLEEANILLAEQSLFIMRERMKLGLGNYLELKESQSSYEAAISRLVTARYNLKESETKLKRITGKFVD